MRITQHSFEREESPGGRHWKTTGQNTKMLGSPKIRSGSRSPKSAVSPSAVKHPSIEEQTQTALEELKASGQPKAVKADTLMTADEMFRLYQQKLKEDQAKKKKLGLHYDKNNWPMLTLKNDFASQLQEKVTQNFAARMYDQMYRIEVPIEDKIRRAQSKIDTGLPRPATGSPRKSPMQRPMTSLVGSGS